MAVRTTGSQYLGRTANLPSNGAATICGWIRLRESVASGWKAAFSWGNTSNTVMSVGLEGNGNQWALFHYDGGSLSAAFPTRPSNGDWVFMAMVSSGTGAGGLKGYQRINQGTLEETAALTSSISGGITALRVGNSTYDGTDFIQGAFAHVKCWDRALTADEILAESNCARPVDARNLNFYWPLWDNNWQAKDLSINGRPATVSGTLSTAEDGPPVSWGADPILILPAATGGGTSAEITESVTASATQAATAARVAAITEAATASESTAGTKVTASTITESATAADACDATVVRATATVTESVTAGEASSVTAAYAVAITESATAGESSATTAARVAAITESITASDSQSALAIIIAAITEAASASESATAAKVTAAAQTESATADESSDATVTNNVFSASITESVTADETSSALATVVAALTEAAAASDSVAATATINAAISELVTVAESSAAGFDTSAAITEAASASDASDATVTTDPFTPAELAFLLAYMEANLAIPTAEEVATAVWAKILGARSAGAHQQLQSAAAFGNEDGAGTTHVSYTDGAAVVEADVPLPGQVGNRTNVSTSGT